MTDEEVFDHEETPNQGHYMKMAKASEKEIEDMRNFFLSLEQRSEDATDTMGKVALANYVINKINGNISGWRRIVEGYELLLDHCCDPSLNYLDFKPELKQKLDSPSR